MNNYISQLKSIALYRIKHFGDWGGFIKMQEILFMRKLSELTEQEKQEFEDFQKQCEQYYEQYKESA
jgi:hypothetical protein